MKTHSYSVYIVASKSRVIYIGMTNNLERRVYKHKNDLMASARNTAAIAWSITSRSTRYSRPSTARNNSSVGTE